MTAIVNKRDMLQKYHVEMEDIKNASILINIIETAQKDLDEIQTKFYNKGVEWSMYADNVDITKSRKWHTQLKDKILKEEYNIETT